MKPNYINLNGQMERVPERAFGPDNGAFRYGYGLFETILVQDGAIRLGTYHWERLANGMKMLGLEGAFTSDWMMQEVMRAVQYCQMERLCRVRLQVYAGKGLFGGGTMMPEFVVECMELDANVLKLNDEGLEVGIYEGMRKQPDAWSGLKTCNALVYALAAAEARKRQWDDALVCNVKGHIIESSIANIFWVKDGHLFTPPLTEGCVEGVMRRHVMDRWPVTEQPLDAATLGEADELFLTNAVRGVRWVANLGAQRFGNEVSKEVSTMLF